MSMHIARARILCGTRGGGVGECRIRHENETSRLPTIPSSGWPDIRGLNELQANRSQWLNGDAIDKSMESYHEALPRQTQKCIHIVDTSIGGLFHESDRQFRNFMKGSYNRFLRRFTECEYTLWPCNYDDVHWELAVIRKGRSNVNSEKWDQVLQVAIIDHWKTDDTRKRNQMIAARLRQILEKIGFSIADNCERTVWTPSQIDWWSCGPRAFWSAKHIMDRIAANIEGGRGYDEQLWAPLPGWFNADQVRWEMIGLNAYEAVKAMEYRARIAVECVRNVLDESGNLQDAASVMRPPPRGGSGSRGPSGPSGSGGPSGSSGKQPEPSNQESDDDDVMMVGTSGPSGSSARQTKESNQESDDDDVVFMGSDVRQTKTTNQESDDGDVIERPPRIPDKRLVNIPLPNERKVAPSWPIKQADSGIPRRDKRNDSVWPRANEGQRPLASAPKRLLSDPSVTGQGDKFLKGNDGGKQPKAGPSNKA